MPRSIKILIADDHPVFRTGLRQIIESDRSFRIIHEAADGRQATDMIEAEPPDVAILDVDMPVLNGLEVARYIQRAMLPVDVVMLTMFKEESMFNKTMDLGVRGYVLKENAVSDIIACIRAVADGRYYISPSIGEYLVRRSGRSTTLAGEQKGLADLTSAERRVLRLLADNYTSKEIAEKLGISIKTVQRHRENTGSKLGIHGPHALLKFAIENKNCF